MCLYQLNVLIQNHRSTGLEINIFYGDPINIVLPLIYISF